MIQLPAIFLSFDDWHERGWAAYLPTLAAHNVRATFYHCFRRVDCRDKSQTDAPLKLRPKFWEHMKAIAAAGHTIGYHGVNHCPMAGLSRRAELDAVIKSEIDRGRDLFRGAGLPVPVHFAYPGGSRNTTTDTALLAPGRFLTLRGYQPMDVPGIPTYTPGVIAETRFFVAADLKHPFAFRALERTLSEKRVIFLSAHKPAEYEKELERLFETTSAGGATFYPMAALV